MEEQWHPIPGHRGYTVSNLGQIRSQLRVDKPPRLLRPLLTGPPGKQYYAVALAGGSRKRIHRLVLEAFIGPCHNGRRRTRYAASKQQ